MVFDNVKEKEDAEEDDTIDYTKVTDNGEGRWEWTEQNVSPSLLVVNKMD